jgi:hypothetical protein
MFGPRKKHKILGTVVNVGEEFEEKTDFFSAKRNEVSEDV